MSNTKFFTKKELAEYFRVSASWVDKAMIYEPEKLPAFIRVGRLVRFPIEEVIKFEQQQLTNVN
ncbi:helix-turn-helix domain-containing protein [Pseudoalteromonas sp. MMG024]|uniref:helix-turn-helix transcriptional regulator n=1 Tax=Pseudoalteromonas sp. MMG024 TaxID=2909980 RepID=UPI001F213078|nr:helix-turn-helix domain-containing protein [Pseudoalteromonas sp. MMG024]MCF6459171.1 helix-turn-helix domain-containing protein [Pseudoalteromonas sp. MMG024]